MQALHSNQTPNHFRNDIRTTKTTLLIGIWVEESRHSDDDVGSTEKCTFEVVGPTVQDEEVNDEGRDKEGDGFEESEVQ